MRAYQLPKGGAGIEALAIVDRPMPKPLYRQVLVKVIACSLNFRDLGIVRGTYRVPVRENLIPLSDGAGEVVEVGPGVTRVKAGDKVAGAFFQRWPAGEPNQRLHASALGGTIDGMLAEYACWRKKASSKFPAHLSIEEGATLAVRRRDRVECHDHHAKLIAGQHGAAARHRRRLGVRAAIRPCHGRSPPSSLRRAMKNSSAPKRSARPAASTTRPRRNGTRRRSRSPAAAASTMSSRSAAPTRWRARSTPSASAARSA